MCECIKQFDKQMAEHNTKISIAFLVNMETGKQSRKVNPPLIATEKLDSSKRGRAMKIVASYCPFCGEKYDDRI